MSERLVPLRPWRRVLTESKDWVGAALVAVLLAALFVSFVLSDRAYTELARDLVRHGTPAAVSDVKVRSTHGSRYTSGSFDVVVTLPSGITTMLRGTEYDDTDLVVGDWARPGERNRYAAPLDVVFDPTDPKRAMAAQDLQEYADGSLLDASTVVAAVVCVVAALVVAFAVNAVVHRRRHPPRYRRR